MNASNNAAHPIYYSPRLLGMITMFFLAGILALNVMMIWVMLLERDMLQTILNNPVAVKFSDVEANNSRLFTVTVAQYIMVLPTAIAFVVWMYRSHKNLRAWGTVGMRFRPYWAWLGFFVPVINLFRPYQIAVEIWQASDPDSDHQQPQSWRKGRINHIISFWWVSLFLLPIFDHYLGHQMLRLGPSRSIEAFLNANGTALVATSFNMLVLVVAIVFVYRLSERQEQKFARLEAESFPFDPPSDHGLGAGGTSPETIRNLETSFSV